MELKIPRSLKSDKGRVGEVKRNPPSQIQMQLRREKMAYDYCSNQMG